MRDVQNRDYHIELSLWFALLVVVAAFSAKAGYGGGFKDVPVEWAKFAFWTVAGAGAITLIGMAIQGTHALVVFVGSFIIAVSTYVWVLSLVGMVTGISAISPLRGVQGAFGSLVIGVILTGIGRRMVKP